MPYFQKSDDVQRCDKRFLQVEIARRLVYMCDKECAFAVSLRYFGPPHRGVTAQGKLGKVGEKKSVSLPKGGVLKIKLIVVRAETHSEP